MLVLPFFQVQNQITYSYDKAEIKKYLPICTNNITADKTYARIVESQTEKAIEYLFYWDHQDGTYKFAQHNHDWEFIVIYTNPNGTIEQINYDSWHYYIGRNKKVDAYNDTNTLVYVDPDFHYFKPDRGIRPGCNITWQITQQNIHELTDEILSTAKNQVGFDPELYKDPFEWKNMGWFGRYTAFDDSWKAFCVVADKKFGFINFENQDNFFTKWL